MEQNPQLGQLFENNPEALMQLLNGGDLEGDGTVPPGAHIVHITPEEQAAIGRVSPSTCILKELVLTFSWL